MEKQKRWQFYLILAVLILTLYNILPTVFYYTKPLKSAIDAPRAEQVAESIVDRVNNLEEESKSWLASFAKLLGISPTSINLSKDDPGIYEVAFSNAHDAEKYRRFLPRAGSLIPFAPAQLELFRKSDGAANTVYVARQINVHLDPKETASLFKFTPKHENGQIAPLYRQIIDDRTTQVALAFGGPSKTGQQLVAIAQNSKDPAYDDLVIAAAKEIVDMDNVLSRTDSAIAKRYFSTFAQNNVMDSAELIQKFIDRMDSLKTSLTSKHDKILADQKKLKEEGKFLDSAQNQQLTVLASQKSTLENAAAVVKKNSETFKAANRPLTSDAIAKQLADAPFEHNVQKLSLEGRNPFVDALLIDWENSTIDLHFYADVQNLRTSEGKTEAVAYQKEKLAQFIINDIARSARLADETIAPNGDGFGINLNTLTSSQSFLTIDLGSLASKQSSQLQEQLTRDWAPYHTDLNHDAYPILSYAEFSKLPAQDQKLGLVVYAPSAEAGEPLPGFRMGSIYVIARNLESLEEKYKQNQQADESKAFFSDLNLLKTLLQQNGFIGYAGSSYGIAPQFNKDYIFELDDFYSNLLKATREDIAVKGSKRYGVLDFTDVEQRILTLNKIDDKEQEDLLKWREEYNSAQVDQNATSKYLVPKPTTNPYWNNLKLSATKYFRGDDRKILKWGLDLSGGKTVRIGLRDHNNRVVTDPDDLKQAVNELYTRINKMGVSERTIHIENNNIILDFPGSQGLSATDLVKASAMYFHIVNEKFSTGNSILKESVNQFLQDVWNEAVVTNRKDIESINEIAWQHLGGESMQGQETRPRSDYATVLWDNGLRLPNPKEANISSSFNDSLSSVAMMRGDDFMEWDGQSHPLLFTFHNFALEGSSLDNIQVGYEPAEGNILSFGVKRSHEGSQDRGSSPRDDFYAWTSQFAEDKITGTPKEAYTNGRGWRMAIILNGTVITKPALNAALRDGGRISGRFSQREVNQLAADLKAGSLSFTPKILSEQNVSPELGQEERSQGITASIVAVALVVLAMVWYYRFAGVVASAAVLLNILIMWGVLQNLDSALTLPAIAGIVLTIGMAVDANVLVFERVREEFKISNRIGSAIQAGYRKAFSAIVDSNITTIIAALILIQFDSGPIKGFAVTLIIGIVSSMFTALFMTRYFFAGWVQNPKNKELHMRRFITGTNFDFLAQTKKAVLLSVVVTVLGAFLFLSQRNTIIGMDFTGGYSLVTEVQEKSGVNDYRHLVAEALLAHGATANDFQIRELSRPEQLRIQLGISMEEKGHPFYQMPEMETEGKFAYPYESNPRLVWLVSALQNSGIDIQPTKLENLERDWTVMSGQFSEAMRDNALMALGLALLSILIYITVRFEFKYALGAVIGLVHDVVITLGIFALFHWMGFPVQIDLQVIAAIMTIIGYSLNDTIIVFDRIREDVKLMRKSSFPEVINHALNVTLSRTIMTSGTTLLVLLTLVLLGGKSIFAFSLVMTIGVVIGTLSSLFIASPVMLFFHNREVKKKQDEMSYRRV